MEETEAGCRITGNVVFISNDNDVSHGPKETLWDKALICLFCIFLLIPLILFFIGYGIYLLYRRIRHMPKELNKEEKLVDFMTKQLFCKVTEQR